MYIYTSQFQNRVIIINLYTTLTYLTVVSYDVEARTLGLCVEH